MGKRKYVRIITVPAVLLLTAGILVMLLPGRFNLSVFSNKKTSMSESILVEINDLFQISAIEYVYKAVFPFDFYDESTDWYSLLMKRNRKETLTEEEKDNLKLYDLSRSIGIYLERPNYLFAVITAVLKAGITAGQPLSEGDISISGSSITVRVPRTDITEFIIEDTSSPSYSYPDINIDPEHWKAIVDFAKPFIKKRVIETGILEEADKRIEELLSGFLYEAGFDTVDIIRK